MAARKGLGKALWSALMGNSPTWLNASEARSGTRRHALVCRHLAATTSSASSHRRPRPSRHASAAANDKGTCPSTALGPPMPKRERDEAVAELVSVAPTPPCPLSFRAPRSRAHESCVRAEFDRLRDDAGGDPDGRRAAVAQGDCAR